MSLDSNEQSVATVQSSQTQKLLPLYPRVTKHEGKKQTIGKLLTWKQYKLTKGITKDSDKASVKAIQRVFMEEKQNVMKARRQVASALISDNDFGTVDLKTWTDSNSQRRVAINLSTKSPDAKRGSQKTLVNASIEELEAQLAKLKGQI
jgi:hypothetical protein